MVPPLPEEYFGNAMVVCKVIVKAGELLGEGGLGKCAWEMNKMISLHSGGEKLKGQYECWSGSPGIRI